jgi:hypothetical protein
MGRGNLYLVEASEKKGMKRIALAVRADADKRPGLLEPTSNHEQKRAGEHG